MTLGFQLQILVNHLKKEKKPSYFEMLLHHICTCILVTNSWMIDQLKPALITMFCHDITDAFLFLGRLLNDFRVNNKLYSF